MNGNKLFKKEEYYLSVHITTFSCNFFSGNILVGKAINELPPFTIAVSRLVIAFIVLLPIGIKSAWNYRKKYLQYKGPLIVMALTGITLFNTFIYGALQFTSTTNVAVLETAIPVVTVILSAFLLKERLAFIQITGIMLSVFGAVWVIMNGNLFNLSFLEWNVGDIIMLGAIIAWAIYSIMLKRYMHLFPLYGTIFVMTGISVIILIPFVLIEWYLLGVPSLSSEKVNGLLYLGIFPSVIAQSCYNRAVELTNPTQASVFLNFLPVTTMLGAYFWLNEFISLMQIIGAFCVINGVLLTTIFKRRKQIF